MLVFCGISTRPREKWNSLVLFCGRIVWRERRDRLRILIWKITQFEAIIDRTALLHVKKCLIILWRKEKKANASVVYTLLRGGDFATVWFSFSVNFPSIFASVLVFTRKQRTTHKWYHCFSVEQNSSISPICSFARANFNRILLFFAPHSWLLLCLLNLPPWRKNH